jgi:hypothetical protein
VKRMLGLLAAMTMAVAACGAPDADQDAAGVVTESVGVTGHWKIDIVDPDGTIDRTIEFDNAFTGAAVLGTILDGTVQVAGWRVSVFGTPNLCASGNGGCFIDGTATWDSTAGELVVTASGPVDADGTIEEVNGLVIRDPGGNGEFSTHDLVAGGQTAPIAAGQTVQIEIRYAFG